MKLFSQRKEFLVSHLAFVFLSVLLIHGCSSSAIENGKLPDSFSWAYGSWIIDVSKSEPDDWEEANSRTYVFIGDNYVQTMTENESKQYVYPYVELMPKSHYDVYLDDFYEYDGDAIDNEEVAEYRGSTFKPYDTEKEQITLCFEGEHGYEAYLFLNKKNKTVSLYNDYESYQQQGKVLKISRNKSKPSSKKEDEHERIMTSFPIIGEWQNIKNRRDKETIDISRFYSSFIPKKDGTWVDYYGDYEYSYDSENDRIIRTYPDSDTDTPLVETYRRYDAEQERLELEKEREQEKERELRRIITSKTFSRMSGDVYSNTTYVLAYKFNSDGSGVKAFYKAEPWGNELQNRETISWDIVDGKLRVYNNAERIYDYYTIQRGLFTNSLVDGGGNEYD